MRPITSRILQATQRSFRTHFPSRQFNKYRRYQTSDASSGASTAGTIHQTTFQRLWNSPVGVKTVHFWAPVMKWALVIAGISDFYRPAEKLSLTQNLALTATGTIWTRWCFVIKPKNYLLAAVNFFLAIVGTIQVSRILTYRKTIGNSPPDTASITTTTRTEARTGMTGAEEGVKGITKGTIEDINAVAVAGDKKVV